MRQVPHSRITLLTSIGAGLEYFDYVIYYLLAGYISQQFFPATNRSAALIATFSLFAISNIVRPLGGVLIGMLGDRYGRKNVFANTLLYMAAASFCIGILPGFAVLGILATILFCLLRIIQGVAFGAELPGALTFLLEHIHGKRRGWYCGLLIAAVAFGVTFGSAINYLLTAALSNAQMLQWGFRIPFVFGALLAIAGFFIRRKIAETPLFLALNSKRNSSLQEISSKHIKSILIGVGVVLFPACFVTFLLAFPVYLHEVFHYTETDIFLVNTLGYLWSALLIPFFGGLSDYLGRKKLFIFALLLMVMLAPWTFGQLLKSTYSGLFLFMGISQTLLAMFAATYFVLLPENFPTEVRFTATALSYNAAYTIAALIPLFANYVYQTLKQPQLLPWMFSGVAIISAVCAFYLKNQMRVSHAN